MKKVSHFYLILLLLCIGKTLIGQDECVSSEFLGQITDYCSGTLEYSNQNTTPSNDASTCLNAEHNDIWFSFQTTQLAVSIKVFGRDNSINPSGLVEPIIDVYESPCSNLNSVGCKTSSQNDTEIVIADLTVGQTYYVRISGEGGDGPFQLCINTFAPPLSPASDCPQGVVLCDKSPFEIEFLIGTGDIANEARNSCLENETNSESNSAWYIWTCDRPGPLTFDIIPNNTSDPEEDLDFAVYRLPAGIGDCANKELLRCMASGETLGAPASQNAPCFGMTGLSLEATDLEETAGCNIGNDNYVAAIDMVRNESYALIINNYSASGFGFSINFGGSGTFLGPTIEMDITALDNNILECEKELTIDENSRSDADEIISWEWNFGVGAVPLRSDQPGEQTVNYQSFGDKFVALTVETQRGCKITEIVDFFVEPCCEDFPDLAVDANITNIVCPGDSTGIIEIVGSGGNPEYVYSTDNVTFGPNPTIEELPAGNYDLYIQDIRGCTASSIASVMQPDFILVDAGPDQIIDLGDATNLFGNIQPDNGNFITLWSPTDSMACPTCLTTQVTPLGTTQYILTLLSSDNCVVADTVTIITESNRPVYIPNIITTQEDIVNNYFKLFGDKSAVSLDDLYIFDAWGSLIYEGHNLPIGAVAGQGWDGTFRGEPVLNGVYVYKAKVTFLDGAEIEYYGDLTVVD